MRKSDLFVYFINCFWELVYVTNQLLIILTFHLSIPHFSLFAAVQMSMQDAAKDGSNQSDIGKVLGDQSFVSSILASVSPLPF